MAWTPESLAAATAWSVERSRGWLDGLAACAAGAAQRVARPDYERTPNDLRLRDPAARWAFGYAEAVHYAARRAMPLPAAWNWAERGQEAMIADARAWWGCGDDTDGVPVPEDCVWRYEAACPLDAFIGRLDGGVAAWQAWFRDECLHSMRDGRAGYGYLVAEEQLEAIVCTLVDGRPYIWDGWHRLGASIVRAAAGNGAPTVMAIVGQPKPELTATPGPRR